MKMNGPRWRWIQLCVVCLLLPVLVLVGGCSRKGRSDGLNIDAGPGIDIGPNFEFDSPTSTPAPTTQAPPDTTTTSPTYTTTPPTYDTAPPPMYYGAIAVGTYGAYGSAYDADSFDSAERRAMNQCNAQNGTNCKVITEFVNGCGAFAYNSTSRNYWGGRGDTPTEAVNNAVANADGGRWITWLCTTR